MTIKSKIGYYFQQAANPGKGVPRENNLNENSKSASNATERDSVVNKDTVELAVEMSSFFGRMKHAFDSLKK